MCWGQAHYHTTDPVWRLVSLSVGKMSAPATGTLRATACVPKLSLVAVFYSFSTWSGTHLPQFLGIVLRSVLHGQGRIDGEDLAVWDGQL